MKQFPLQTNKISQIFEFFPQKTSHKNHNTKFNNQGDASANLREKRAPQKETQAL